MKCKLCNSDFKNCRFLLAHLKSKHLEISKLEYLMNYHFDSKIGLCRNCGKQVKFISFSRYDIYCCKKCRQEYEHKHPEMMKVLEIKKRRTLLKKYGVEYPMAIKGAAEKLANTKLKKYGDSNYNNIEKYKETCIKKYGMDNIFRDSKYIKKCTLKKLGVENAMQDPKIWNKAFQTKVKKGNVNTSKPEETLYLKLIEKFGAPDIIRQYKSPMYPYNCDFYIKSLDLYIELQGTWVHGSEPYNPENPEHIKIVEFWKSKNTKFYNKAIEIWTIRDVEKRKIASENNLNYIEVFDFETFKEIEFLFN